MRRRAGLRGALLGAMLALNLPAAAQETQAALPELGLMGTIPLYWGEAEGLGELVAGTATAHWARARLERQFRLQPLATLDAAALAPLNYLLMAQPQALTPAENVALDAWVRGGGRLLLFADPLLSGESRFGIGDRRRPQDVIMLSPILDHWGLPLAFDEDQPGEARVLRGEAAAIPVRLPGRFTPAAAGGPCELALESVLARCRLGQGRALVLADAALLDMHQPAVEAPAALDWLLQQAFGVSGDHAGSAGGPLKNEEYIGNSVGYSNGSSPLEPAHGGGTSRSP